MFSTMNARILIIDDDESVRDGFRDILAPKPEDNPALDAAASALFGPAPTKPAMTQRAGLVDFEVETAARGEDGINMVSAAIAAAQPYAVVFCDMRMPGLDGLQTVQRIRAMDQRAEVVFVTAYSDHSLETIVERAGANVGYFVKPFLSDEILQLATKLVMSWNRARELEALLETLTSLRSESDDDRLLELLLGQVCRWLGADSAALLSTDSDPPVFHLGVGELKTETMLRTRFPESINAREVVHVKDGYYLPIPDYGVAIALTDTEVTSDREHMLEVFLRYAGLAIRNVQIAAELAEKRRMASMGQAIAYLVHDLRGPIGFSQMLLNMHREVPGSLGSDDVVYDKLETSLSRALSMLTDTLAFCRGGIEVSPRIISIQETLTAPAELWSIALAEDGITLTVVLEPNTTGTADPEMLVRALWNLIMNAAKARAPGQKMQVTLTARRHGDQLEFTVADTGTGLSEHLQEVLFLPFADRKRAGNTGFGLAIVKEIVEAHGGTIGVSSSPAGTTFTLSLPDAAH